MMIGLIGDLEGEESAAVDCLRFLGEHGEGVAPLLLAHGHFHVADQDSVTLPGAAHTTTIWSLAARHTPGNVRVLDLDDLGTGDG